MRELILILAIITGLGGAVYIERGVAIAKAEKAVTDRLNSKFQEQLIAEQERSKEASLKLKASHYLEVEEKNNAIKTISNKLYDVTKRLSNRPSRPIDIAGNPTDTKACTGAILYREDGEFLAGEAARADKVVAERDYYYAEYENLRKILEEMTNK